MYAIFAETFKLEKMGTS